MKNISEKIKVGSLVGINFLGAGGQVVQAAQETSVVSEVESYLRIILLAVQIAIGMATAIYVYRRLKNKPKE